MSNFVQNFYNIKNPEKYIGTKNPYYRSSWELMVCTMCDNNPAIIEWASEPVKIPYRNPITKKQTVYVPDFLVMFEDKHGKRRAEMWEIKPQSQFKTGKVKRPKDQLAQIVNMAKWEAARRWCTRKGITFRVIDETSLLRDAK